MAAGSDDATGAHVRDLAGRFNVILLMLGIALAGATLVVGLTPDDDPRNDVARVALFVIAAASAVVGYMKWRNEKAFKEQERGLQRTLAELLEAERVRTLTITNGAFQASARQLQELAAKDVQGRRMEISGFRQSVVDKACDLVRNDSPRSAYFRVEDLFAARRTMTTSGVVAARGRTDEFTTAFVEGSGVDENVWHLIDFEEEQIVDDVDTQAPAEFDTSRPRAYRSYVSVPVRVGSIAFGMLTINTIEKDGFAVEDVAALRVLARLLGAGEAVTLSSNEWNRLRELRAAPPMSQARDTLSVDKEAD